MDHDKDNLIDEINELKNEVKMLRAIVQSLMYVITDDQDVEMDSDLPVDDKQSYFGTSQTRNYVS
jgi:hypothetical protein